MAEKEWMHRLHGDDLHDLVIFLAERLIVQKGGKLKPTRDFRGRKLCPCEPDIFFEIETKLIEGNRRIKQRGLYVVEIETKATYESRITKYKQYKETLTGLVDLIIIDLYKEFPEWANDRFMTGIAKRPEEYWTLLQEFIEARLPT